MKRPFHLQDYLELLGWTERQFRQGKRGVIEDHLSPILVRLNPDLDQLTWTATTSGPGY